MDRLLELDGNILLWIQENIRNDFLDPIMKFITSLGNGGLVWIVIAILLLVFKSTRKVGATVFLAMIYNLVVLNVIMKNLFSRIRPYEVIDELTRIVPAPSDFSFPSGHAGHSFAAAVVMMVMLPRKYGVPALVLAILMSVSRRYVGVHYPTDVLGGCIIGTIMAILSILTVKAIEKRKSETKIFD